MITGYHTVQQNFKRKKSDRADRECAKHLTKWLLEQLEWACRENRARQNKKPKRKGWKRRANDARQKRNPNGRKSKFGLTTQEENETKGTRRKF